MNERSPSPADAEGRKPLLAFLLPSLVVAMGSLAVLGGLLAARRAADAPPPSEVVVHPLAAGDGLAADPTLDPAGERIAWISDDGGSYGLHVRDVDGEGPGRILVELPEPMTRPVFSPDGERLLYIHDGAVRTVRVDDATVETLAATDGTIRQALWERTPGDGNAVLVVHGEGPARITRVDPSTGDQQDLTAPDAPGEGDVFAALSPHGEHLAFLRRSLAGRVELMVMKLATGELRSRARIAPETRHLAWTADGSAFLFTAAEGVYRMPSKGGDAKLAVPADTLRLTSPVALDDDIVGVREEIMTTFLKIDRDGNPTMFLKSSFRDRLPRWSPDGTRIAWVRSVKGGAEIRSILADGSGERRLVRLGALRVTSLAWTADGSLLAFADGGRLLRVTADGKLQRQNLPEGTVVESPIFSDDGAALLYSSDEDGTWQRYRYDLASGERRTESTLLDASIVAEDFDVAADGTSITCVPMRSTAELVRVEPLVE